MRQDPAIQTAVERKNFLASSATLCRLEHRMDRQAAVALHKVLVQQFIDSHKKSPRKLILDFDAADDRVHGMQEGRFFHGYYDHYCFLPKNLRLLDQVEIEREVAADDFEATGEKVRFFESICYGASTWKVQRRVIPKIEHTDKGSNPRFIVTNLKGSSQSLYDGIYCARGEMEKFIGNEFSRKPQRGEAQGCAEQNRIKEQQLWLFADRTSSHYWWANKFRLLLSSLAYVQAV